VQYLVNHPDAAWDEFKSYKADLDDELNRRAWRDTISRFALRPAALDVARYERFAQFVLERGLAKSMPAVETYTTVLK
jgi:putative hydroxymethylpyrimidine transport system substrate-binding protein